jgi:16S rRNA (cytosine967-C5)-methyltransferase
MHLSEVRFNLAISALTEILQAQQPADVVLGNFLHKHKKLGSNDRSYIADTVFAILRRHLLLRHLCHDATPRRLFLAYLAKSPQCDLNGLSPHLRGSEKQWMADIRPLSEDKLSLALRSDLPEWITKKLAKFMDAAEILALGQSLQHSAPLDLRVNTLLASREAVLSELAQRNINASLTPYSPLGIRLGDKPAINRDPLFLSGKIEVQDEGSQLLCYLLEPKRHDMVVDFCAGAGGKTLTLGAMMRSHGRIYAFDPSEKRISRLKPRLKRSGLSNVHAQCINNENDLKIKRLHGKIDKVLVDAPCSGLGTLRRNPDLKLRLSSVSVEELSEKQFAILNSAAKLLKSGGRLVYATCSFLAEENEKVVERFLACNPNFSLLNCAEILENQQIPLKTGRYLKLYPHLHHTDGFFAAALEKSHTVPNSLK